MPERVVREDIEAAVGLRREVGKLERARDRDVIAASAAPAHDPTVDRVEHVDRAVGLDVERRRPGEAELARAGQADLVGLGAPRPRGDALVGSAYGAEDVPAER